MPLQNRFKNLIDNNPMSTFQIVIVAICFILNFNDGIDVLVVSFSSSDIIKEWGLTKAEMGYVFSAGLAGMTIGCFAIAPLADKIGRRKIFLLSLVLISGGMLGVAACHSYWLLLTLRFLTGLGIGGILPTMAATASEFANKKHRDFCVSLVQAGWPVGAIFTGFFCAYAIPQFGWRFAFLCAGCISFLMLLMVYFYMTDSLDFLIKNQPKNALDKINAQLVKMGQAGITELPEKPILEKAASVQTLFSDQYRDATLKTWLAIFFGFLTLYTLMSWVPNIAKDSGMPFELATFVGIALNAGAAIGSASIGAIGSRLGLRQTILTFMLLAFAAMQVFGNFTLSTTLIFVVIFFIGMFVQGGFNGIWPTLARIYPTEIRTTGVGFAVGVGRLGAVLGPLIFGALSDAGLSISTLFLIFSVPLLVNGFAVWTLKSKALD